MSVISIWITSDCNMKCTYCYEMEQLKYKGCFDEKRIPELVTFIKNKNPNVVVFYGGEPLINFSAMKKIFEEVHAFNPEIKFSFTTNGILLKDEICDFLIDNVFSFNSMVSISMDGSRETFDKCRRMHNGTSVYENVLASVKSLLRVMNLRARMTVVPETAGNLYENIVFLYELGFRTIIPIYEIYKNEWHQEDFETLNNQYEKIVEFWLRKPYFELGIIKELMDIKEKSPCKCGVNIYVNGDIYPCTCVVGFSKFRIGNITNGINKKRVRELNTEFQIENENCRKCLNKKLCVYERCKLYNYSLTRDLYKPNEAACKFEHFKNIMRFQYYEKLKKGYE